MADVLWSDVASMAAQLASVDATAQGIVLAYANDCVNVAALGGEDAPKTKLARVLLAAHFGELVRRRGDGAVTGETFAAASMALTYERTQTDDDLRTTPYGTAYLGVINASGARVGFAL